MTKKIFLALAALTALTLCFSSCKKDDNNGGGTGNTPKPKTEVKLRIDNKDVKVVVGKTAQLSVAVEPADTKCTFESANADIATVSDSGLITGVKAGKTVITVKAGDATKTANVEVIDANAMDESRYAGKDAEDKETFVPFYIAPVDQMADQKDLIKIANEAKGWMFNKDLTLKGGIKALDFSAPYDKDNYYTDNRLLSEIAYVYAGVDKAYMMVFTKAAFKEEIIEKALNKDEKAQQYLYTLSASYGFTEESGLGETGDGTKCYVAYNLKQFPEGPYEMLVTPLYKEDGSFSGQYKLQICQRAPQKSQAGRAMYEQLMPEFKGVSSLEKLSNR